MRNLIDHNPYMEGQHCSIIVAVNDLLQRYDLTGMSVWFFDQYGRHHLISTTTPREWLSIFDYRQQNAGDFSLEALKLIRTTAEFCVLKNFDNIGYLSHYIERGFGINGLIIPMLLPNNQSLSFIATSDKTDEEWAYHRDAIKHHLIQSCYQVSELVKSIVDLSTQGNIRLLDDRKRRILTLLAQGETVQAIGQSMTLSVRTIDAQLQEIRAIFGARSNPEAVAKAIDQRLIRPIFK